MSFENPKKYEKALAALRDLQREIDVRELQVGREVTLYYRDGWIKFNPKNRSEFIFSSAIKRDYGKVVGVTGHIDRLEYFKDGRLKYLFLRGYYGSVTRYNAKDLRGMGVSIETLSERVSIETNSIKDSIIKLYGLRESFPDIDS